MIIRRHMIFMSAERIGQAVVGNIDKQIQVVASNRFQNNTFCFTGSKTRYFRLHQIRASLIPFECKTVLVLIFPFCTPVNQVLIDLLAKLLAAL